MRSRSKSRTGSLSNSYSDPCLVRRQLDMNSFKANSAPGSSIGSSDDDDSVETGLEAKALCAEIERAPEATDVTDAWAKIEGAFENLEKDPENEELEEVKLESCENNGNSEHQKEKDEEEESKQANLDGDFQQAKRFIKDEVSREESQEMSAEFLEKHQEAWEGVKEESSEGGGVNLQRTCDIEEEQTSKEESESTPSEAEKSGKENSPEAKPQTDEDSFEKDENVKLDEESRTVRSDEEGEEVAVDIDLKNTRARLKLHSSSSGSEEQENHEHTNSPEPADRKKFTDRFRIPGNRSPKLNIFATAQARGRNIIPDLRSKLSSFSQQMRNRGSPRLGLNRGFSNDTSMEQKVRRRKCRTKIIEL